jgi:hypothetical protein
MSLALLPLGGFGVEVEAAPAWLAGRAGLCRRDRPTWRGRPPGGGGFLEGERATAGKRKVRLSPSGRGVPTTMRIAPSAHSCRPRRQGRRGSRGAAGSAGGSPCGIQASRWLPASPANEAPAEAQKRARPWSGRRSRRGRCRPDRRRDARRGHGAGASAPRSCAPAGRPSRRRRRPGARGLRRRPGPRPLSAL